MKSRSSAFPVASLLFCSGFCALIYQTVWLREFRLIFGASTAASAAVLGIFMGGLGLGSALLGRRSEKAKMPLVLYGDLEFLIALAAALTPFLVAGVRHLYAMTGGSMVLGHAGATVVRLLLATVVLIIPTFLMGGTLPAAARAVASQSDVGRRSLALLYGCNTLGAVTGAVVSTFVLIEHLGNRDTLWFACGMNMLVALVARLIGRQRGVLEEPVAEHDSRTVRGTVPWRFVLIAAGAVGFAFMLMELVWYRMLAPLLGGSTFTFGLILAVALFGIGVGGAAYAFLAGDRRPTLGGFALSCAVEALFIAAPYAAGDHLARLAGLLRGLGGIGFDGQVLGWTLITSVVVLPASVVAGYQFPMLIALLGAGDDEVGRHTGLAYAANTAGAIVGSLAGGFGLLPLLTAPGGWIAVVVVLAALAVAAALWSLRENLRLATPALVTAAVACALLLNEGPTAEWRHSGIGAGRGEIAGMDRNTLEEWGRYQRRSIMWEEDGRESCVGLNRANGYAFVMNGKIDGNIRADAGTQVMSGLVPTMLRPGLQHGLVIGLGTGSTAGWLASVPEMQRVDVVELEPATLEIARRCAPANLNVLENPKVRMHIADAREVLLTTPERYDFIFSEPSNPYRAGIASLFTRDFYEAVVQRLTPDGIFAQWIQAYEIDGEAVRTAFATLGSVFPNIQTWQTQGGDFILLASHKPIAIDAGQLKQRMHQEPFRSALLNAWHVDTLEGVLAHFVAGEKLARVVVESGAEPATDDRNSLEFGFARNVGIHAGEEMIDQLRQVAVRYGCAVPGVNGDVDWQEVENQVAAARLRTPKADNAAGQDSPAIGRRAFLHAYLQNDFPRAAKTWNSRPFEPGSVMELYAVAESLARAGDPQAWRFIEQLAAFNPGDADALAAAAFAHDKLWPEAGRHLQKAFSAWQKDPWPKVQIVMSSLDLADSIARLSGQVSIARDLYTSLQTPFAVEIARNRRLESLLTVAQFTEARRANQSVRDVLEQYGNELPWKGPLLELRALVYKEFNDPRMWSAAEDLLRFRSAEMERFDHGLRAPAPALAKQP